MKPISVYAPNLASRPERRAHIEAQFAGRPEFHLTVVTPVPHRMGTVSLWRTFLSIVRRERETGSEFFIFCEDDHTFTPNYTWAALQTAIREADALGADVLSGGVSWAGNAVQLSDRLFWLRAFNGMQFTVVFRRFYDVLLNSSDTLGYVTDLRVSQLSHNIFVVFPYFSIQQEFGYSDATRGNNDHPGRVERMFKRSQALFASLDKVRTSYRRLPPTPEMDLDDVCLPTYVIHLPEHTDRQAHIERQFADRPEFDFHWVEACRAERGADGLWQSIRKVVAQADADGDDVILICEDDHEFTPDYNRHRFLAHVVGAAAQGAHLLFGGVGGFGRWVPVAPGRFWTDWAWCTQFTVVYRPAFRRILEADFGPKDVADEFLSRLLPNKMVIFPFVSEQHDFGYSDITPANNQSGTISRFFQRAQTKGAIYQRIVNKYQLLTKIIVNGPKR